MGPCEYSQAQTQYSIQCWVYVGLWVKISSSRLMTVQGRKRPFTGGKAEAPEFRHSPEVKEPQYSGGLRCILDQQRILISLQ